MEFKEFIRWKSDNMPETTDAVVVVSSCGTCIKRMEYVRWNKKNNTYSRMKEKIYSMSCNRGKQVRDPDWKKEKHGMYMHAEIRGKVYSVHRIVAEVFVDNPNLYDCVNHKDGVRNNNHFKNLEWVSNKANQDHAWVTGLRDITRMRKLPYSEIPLIMKMRNKKISYAKIGAMYGMAGESIRHRVKQYENGIRY
jgi:hypothetical protein